jgi:hypothetical protein
VYHWASFAPTGSPTTRELDCTHIKVAQASHQGREGLRTDHIFSWPRAPSRPIASNCHPMISAVHDCTGTHQPATCTHRVAHDGNPRCKFSNFLVTPKYMSPLCTVECGRPHTFLPAGRLVHPPAALRRVSVALQSNSIPTYPQWTNTPHIFLCTTVRVSARASTGPPCPMPP